MTVLMLMPLLMAAVIMVLLAHSALTFDKRGQNSERRSPSSPIMAELRQGHRGDGLISPIHRTRKLFIIRPGEASSHRS
jgi:hypothetical protein